MKRLLEAIAAASAKAARALDRGLKPALASALGAARSQTPRLLAIIPIILQGGIEGVAQNIANASGGHIADQIRDLAPHNRPLHRGFGEAWPERGAQRLWQMGAIILQAAAQTQGGGFGVLQATIHGWLAGSQGAALAIASILPIIGACSGQGPQGEWDSSLPSNVYCVGVRDWHD